MAMQAEWYRQQGHEVYWGGGCANPEKVVTVPENIPFSVLPAPDRLFTKAKEYTSGNYKHLPGTHIMSAAGCWWGRCKFCVENGKNYKERPVFDVIEEIRECEELGFREVFDDSDTFPVGEWLDEFLSMKEFDSEIPISCNMRFGVLDEFHYKKMKWANFRMILYGLESANQDTLNTIHKGTSSKQAIEELKMASKIGLEPHIAVMFGYPWETEEDSINTLKLVWHLLRKGYAKTAQASFYQPPDGKNNPEHKKYVKMIYNAGFHLDFWMNRLKSIRNIDDILYIWRGIKCALKS